MAEEFRPQVLLDVAGWHLDVDGVRMLGILRVLNTVLVVLLALIVHKALRRVPDTRRMYIGIVLFVAGFMGLAVAADAWLLLALGVVYTIGEVMNVPMRQALMADLIDPSARATYMALFGLRTRGAMLIASLCVVGGAFLGPYGMAMLYAGLGGAAVLLLREPVRAAEARRAAAVAPDANRTGEKAAPRP
ncbi:MFS transporter [Streptomyces poonensis]|uniref:MFS transporter n=1 Tax=Streptomyces poonensis TaxID=68255 RepID=A0A918PU34_9ACTN|nr:MFS transporter [Streptomyces poonensis]GGZ21246.1 hypothetical protein GCM10010365_47030 [Streptomyces poonensis]